MTREEAIDVLKKTIAYESDFAEAKRMAIEALSAEAHLTCKTCADRATCIMAEPDGNWKACKDYRAEQVASKLQKPCDSLLTGDSGERKEQKSKLDLISRADAIEAVVCHIWHMPNEAYRLFNCENMVRDVVEDAIKRLPSAETHEIRTEMHGVCSDLISRVDAMDAVQDHFNADGFKGYDDGQKMMDRLKALPSADASDTHDGCSDCRYESKDEYEYPCCECSGNYTDKYEPKGDEVEVILCKYCKHWYADADTGMACEFTNMGQPEDGYCNWAERR